MRVNKPSSLVLMVVAAAAMVPAAAYAQPKPPANPTAQATLLGQYGDWGAYTASPGGRKVCFALSKPTAQQDNPPNRRTAANVVYMFVSTRPDEKVSNEISLLVSGYAFKPNSEATMTIANGGFPMYTQNDGAWVKNAAEEAQMVATMRKGATLVVKSESAKGTKSTDTYSLKGLGEALDKVAEECK